MYYLVDGRLIKSLGTTVKRFAEYRLDQYNRRKFGFAKGITVAEFYDQWIERKREPMVRRSALRDYRQHFNAYILPAVGKMTLSAIEPRVMERMRDELLGRGLAAKTVRNIIGASLRRMWRDARKDRLVSGDPFELLDFPAGRRLAPDPFTAAERDKLLAYVLQCEPFYYPWIRFQFETGARPGEASALTWADVSVEHCSISITKSKHMGRIDRPKTQGSWRTIEINADLMALINSARLPWHGSDDPVFYNKVHGAALNANEWARSYWSKLCSGAKVPHRKFYSTRHTSITEAVKAGANLLAIAQYHGTSVAMIERNYCGALTMATGDQTKIKPALSKLAESLVVPTGLEPGHQSFDKIKHQIIQAVEQSWKRRSTA